MTKFNQAFWFINSNFGDALNHYILNKLSPKQVIYCSDPKTQKHIVAIGSILNWANENSVVWGAGLASRDDQINPEASYVAVRGPISGQIIEKCGGINPGVYGDPALLLPKLFNPSVLKVNRVGIIPHYTDQAFYAQNCLDLHPKLKFIDVLKPVEQVITEICSCERIISSSLHGLIVADAYGIPSMRVNLDEKIGGDGMKYDDYFESVGTRPYAPVDIEKLFGKSEAEIHGIIGSYIPTTIDIAEKLLKVFPFQEG